MEDLLAGVDHVIKMGVADPDKLGVGGWSYGGILTDYMIATDHRFKGGTSGAGTAFTVSFYGTDQYILQYDYEIGPPWTAKGWDTYVKISYPFLHADRITTPTLFLGGERDFNVPVQGGQQMYQALRSLGIETQLVIYPNEFHGISRPSYVKDRYERYLGLVRQVRAEESGSSADRATPAQLATRSSRRDSAAAACVSACRDSASNLRHGKAFDRRCQQRRQHRGRQMRRDGVRYGLGSRSCCGHSYLSWPQCKARQRKQTVRLNRLRRVNKELQELVSVLIDPARAGFIRRDRCSCFKM